jgi:type I restriction enzyme M protein
MLSTVRVTYDDESDESTDEAPRLPGQETTSLRETSSIGPKRVLAAPEFNATIGSVPTTSEPLLAARSQRGGGSDLAELDRRLWAAADHLRANSKLKPSEYSVPVLGLIFLFYADRRYEEAKVRIEVGGSTRQRIGPTNYHAENVAHIPESARFGHLLELPEETNLGRALNEAMAAVEADNPDLVGVLPRTYTKIDNGTLVELLKLLNGLPKSLDGDSLGLIYEYFLGEFARAEGQKGGEFFTPTSIVRLIVEIIEPFHGKILDPACGSGGMFVQSAHFVERHAKAPVDEISIYGQERIEETVRIARMNLAIHGLSGTIREGNTYYEDLHGSVGRFDFVMANPPFNVDKIDKAKLEGDQRFPFGLPRADNGNYIWIQIFYSALNAHGRAGFVMANSAGDASGSESGIRRKLIEDRCVDVIVSIGSNFFYTVTLPVTLWFLDKGKRSGDRVDKVLFLDAKKLYRQIDRAHRDFEPRQIALLASIVRLYRGEEPEVAPDSAELMAQHFPDRRYVDVAGLCKVVTVAEIEAQGWSLNPGRYVGTAVEEEDSAEEFLEKLTGLYKEFRDLSADAEILGAQVEAAIEGILEG